MSDEKNSLYINTATGEAVVETVEETLARDRVDDCNCDMIACVCLEVRKHKATCGHRESLLCPIGIECQHGYDVCPTCDPCTCGAES